MKRKNPEIGKAILSLTKSERQIVALYLKLNNPTLVLCKPLYLSKILQS